MCVEGGLFDSSRLRFLPAMIGKVFTPVRSPSIPVWANWTLGEALLPLLHRVDLVLDHKGSGASVAGGVCCHRIGHGAVATTRATGQDRDPGDILGSGPRTAG